MDARGKFAHNNRRGNALEAARQARQVGMRAIVIKNHSYPTTPLAIMVGQLVPEVAVFGSICLDYDIGGLNADALEKHADMGARVVWMPTFSSANSRPATEMPVVRSPFHLPEQRGCQQLDRFHRRRPGRVSAAEFPMLAHFGHLYMA